MLLYLTCLVFIVSVALAAGGIIISSKLLRRQRHELFSNLLYFQIFIHAFGFYGIWGQVLIKAVISEYVSAELLARFTDTGLLLGLPFALFAWLMLIQMANSASGRRRSRMFTFLFLVINALLLITIGYTTATYLEPKPAVVLKSYYIFMNSFYTLIAAALFIFAERGAEIAGSFRIRIASGIVAAAAIQTLVLLLYSTQVYLALIFIILFFAGNVFLPLILNYGRYPATLRPEADGEVDVSFEGFCRKFDVSPREKEIIREICNGLSNKEISEKLFISLQTVKDHSHRIYIKTNVRSRVQLITLVKEMMGK